MTDNLLEAYTKLCRFNKNMIIAKSIHNKDCQIYTELEVFKIKEGLYWGNSGSDYLPYYYFELSNKKAEDIHYDDKYGYYMIEDKLYHCGFTNELSWLLEKGNKPQITQLQLDI